MLSSLAPVLALAIFVVAFWFIATERADKVKTVPVFDLRELRGFVPFRPSPIDRLKPGIPHPLDDFRGVPFKTDSARELLIRDPLVVEDPARTYDVCSGTGTPMGVSSMLNAQQHAIGRRS